MEEIKSKKKRSVNILGKKVSLLAVFGLLVIGMGSATLVGYLSNTISEEITIDSPLSLEGTEFDLELDYAGEDDFVLFKLINHADTEITGDLEIAVDSNVAGINLALTEDINYCFKNQGNLNGVGDCANDYLVWLGNNIDWNDWVASSSYSDALYPSSLVVDTNGDSFTGIGYTGNSLILPGLAIPAGEKVYGVMYVSTDAALSPGTYTFNMRMVP